MANAIKTTCPKGHEYNATNCYIYTDPQGYEHRHCRVCRRKAQQDFVPAAERGDNYGKTFYNWQSWGVY